MKKQNAFLTNRELREFIHKFFVKNGIGLFGLADLRGLTSLKDDSEDDLCAAISFAVPMNPEVMAGIENGPNQYYAKEYARVNGLINALSLSLAGRLKSMGYQARALHVSDRTDPVNLKGDFPHKTAATRAGLGWIGRNCQLVTKQYGPWIRLGTIFLTFPGGVGHAKNDNLDGSQTSSVPSEKAGDDSVFGIPVIKSFCGDCQMCVEACPADALLGSLWHPGIAREEILDAWRCEHWKREHYYQFHKGHNCGICSAVCPFGKKQLRT